MEPYYFDPEMFFEQLEGPLENFLIMFFGAGNNFISAILILFLIALIWGGTSMKPIVSSVEEGYPAYKAGMKAGDKIVVGTAEANYVERAK